MRFLALEAADLRFPTSARSQGSDAMHPEPDYSAAVCVLKTSVDGLEGHGLTFTIGRGNEVVCAAIAALMPADAPQEQKVQNHVTFLLNFFDEVRRRAPAGN